MSQSRIAAPVKVLVASADADYAREAAESLAQGDFVVELAMAAEDAFDRVRSFEPDVILYDMDLEGYEGLEAIRLLARMRAAKKGFILARSREASPELAALALEAGAWDVFTAIHRPRDLVATAQAIKVHMRRPKEIPTEPVNQGIKTLTEKCARLDCRTIVVGFALRAAPMLVKKDQFETPLYRKARAGGEFVDYNLLSVAVCPGCYWAVDLATDVEGRGATPRFPRDRSAPAPRPVLLRMAAGADDLLFSEERSPRSAIVAYSLAIENLKGRPLKTPAECALWVDLYLKAGSVAHLAGEASERDRFFAEAERVCSLMMAMDPCQHVYRAAYRLVALYVFFTRDKDAAATLDAFEKFYDPVAGRRRPRDGYALERYKIAAGKIASAPEGHRRAKYLAGRG